jgi:DNA-binding GntR family transcriptional regulator
MFNAPCRPSPFGVAGHGAPVSAETSDVSNYDNGPFLVPPGSSLRDAVAAFIRREIFAGRMRRGARIDLDEIADRLQVSRLPVREALIALETEGFVTWIRRRGTAVADITEADVRDHFELLAFVMGLVIQRAVPALTDEQLAQVDRASQRVLESDDSHIAATLEHALHSIVTTSGLVSQRLLHEQAKLIATIPMALFMGTERGAVASQRSYQRTAPALLARDTAGLRAEVESLIREQGEAVISELHRRQFWD